MRFSDVPQFTRDGSYQVDMPLEYLIKQITEWESEDGLQLNPDFQRGHVWTEEQQVRFIEFILKGGKTGRILYFNNPSQHWDVGVGAYNDFVCVDGLQRITAIQRFLSDEITAFGQKYSEYGDKTDIMRHGMKVNINDLKSKREVLQWYIEMNSGGTPHSDKEIERVKALMEKEEGA